MDMGKLDERELSPASISIHATAATKSKTTPTQPRDGNLRAKRAMETPTTKAAKLRIGNRVSESMRVKCPLTFALRHGATEALNMKPKRGRAVAWSALVSTHEAPQTFPEYQAGRSLSGP